MKEITEEFEKKYSNARFDMIRKVENLRFFPLEFISESDVKYHFMKELKEKIGSEFLVNSEVPITEAVTCFSEKVEKFNKIRKEKKIDNRNYVIVDLGVFSKDGDDCKALMEFTYGIVTRQTQPVFDKVKDTGNFTGRLTKLKFEINELESALETKVTKEGYVIFLDELVYEFRNESIVREAIKSDKHIHVFIRGTDFKERENVLNTHKRS